MTNSSGSLSANLVQTSKPYEQRPIWYGKSGATNHITCDTGIIQAAKGYGGKWVSVLSQPQMTNP